MAKNRVPFNGDALFFYRGRLARAPMFRGGRWLITLVVRNDDEVYFPTIMLPGEPPDGLEFRHGLPPRYQPLVSVVGIPQTRNVTYTTMGEIAYVLRRAGFPALVPLLERLLPARVRKAPQRHVRYNFLATDLTIEEVPEVPRDVEKADEEEEVRTPADEEPEEVA